MLPVHAVAAGLPRNVAIEVEFKETTASGGRTGLIAAHERYRGSQYIKQSILVSDGLTGTIRVKV